MSFYISKRTQYIFLKKDSVPNGFSDSKSCAQLVMLLLETQSGQLHPCSDLLSTGAALLRPYTKHTKQTPIFLLHISLSH